MTDDDRPTGTNPHVLSREGDATEVRRAFWADEVADVVETRDPDDPVVIKGGVSPSGIPHIGHANEVMRGYYVAEALRDRGHEVRQVFTSDDRDPLRKVPRTLMSADGEVVGLDAVDAGALGRNLGKPLTDVPDPFGCHNSFGAHQTALLARSAELLEVPLEVVSNTDLYESGAFDGVVGKVLSNLDVARETLSAYQDKVDERYAPFRPVCANCGIVTEGVTDVDPEAGTVSYVCTDIEAGNRTIDGCGHEGVATVREGKLSWRFEWPAQWQVLGVDFEPFGKDHAEGSWPSGEDIARTVFGIDPPVPMVYEWFTYEGEALSSSSGHVITVGEVLDFLEPEVFRYFFVKDPKRARDFAVETADELVGQFDRFEAAFFDEGAESEKQAAVADRAYPMVAFGGDGDVVGETPAANDWVDPVNFVADADEVGNDADTDADTNADGQGETTRDRRRRYLREVFADRVRLPYRFAAVLGMTENPAIRTEIARREGHLPADAPDWAAERGLARVEFARSWARRTGNEYDYDLKRESMPDVAFDPTTETALDDLADFVAGHDDGEEIQGEIYETARRHDVDVGEFFSAGYRLFFDDDQGPRLGPFLAQLDRDFVVKRLRREG